jgi:DNA-binding winged helix-turn-helix (wHTH) protein
MELVWNEPSQGQDRKLTVHMSRLRKKMGGSQPWHIETITKRGYALAADKTVGSGRAPHRSGPRSTRRLGGLA